jgi:hypothetical protein
MIPDDVHSKPVYRRLAPRPDEEIALLKKQKAKMLK